MRWTMGSKAQNDIKNKIRIQNKTAVRFKWSKLRLLIEGTKSGSPQDVCVLHFDLLAQMTGTVILFLSGQVKHLFENKASCTTKGHRL